MQTGAAACTWILHANAVLEAREARRRDVLKVEDVRMFADKRGHGLVLIRRMKTVAVVLLHGHFELGKRSESTPS